MLPHEKIICENLGNVSILPGTWDKRFCRDVAHLAKNEPEKELTSKQRVWMWHLLKKYRRQLPYTYLKYKDLMKTTFEIFYREENGKHFLTFSPKPAAAGYPPKEVEVTKEQWDSLQFHFAKGINDKEKKTVLAHVA